LAHFTGAVTYGMGNERHRVGLTRTMLPVSGLPPALDGLRIAFITDVHHSLTVPADDVTRAVTLANGADPDLVVLGGDYVTWGDRQYVAPVAELLRPLHARYGVFAILGNHDDDRDMPAALMRNGFTVLRDQRTRVELRGEALELAGIRFGRAGSATSPASSASHATSSCSSRTIPGGLPRPPRSTFLRCCPDTRMGGRSCCLVLAPSPVAISPC
jgi:predicted MPP superfamily phosphohydrolase